MTTLLEVINFVYVPHINMQSSDGIRIVTPHKSQRIHISNKQCGNNVGSG